MKLADKGIIIRKTVEEDLPQIYSAGISEPSFQFLPLAFNTGNLADRFASDKSILYSAVRKKKVMGFIIGSVNGTESTIHWMMVKETFRKAGIGKELLRLYLNKSEKFSTNEFLITVSDNKTDALDFFTSKGFTLNNTSFRLKKI